MDHGECEDRAQIGMARCLLSTLFAQGVGGYNLLQTHAKCSIASQYY